MQSMLQQKISRIFDSKYCTDSLNRRIKLWTEGKFDVLATELCFIQSKSIYQNSPALVELITKRKSITLCQLEGK